MFGAVGLGESGDGMIGVMEGVSGGGMERGVKVVFWRPDVVP